MATLIEAPVAEQTPLGRRPFNRPPRLRPRLAVDRFEVPAPPTSPGRSSGSLMSRLLIPLITAVASGAIFGLFALTSSGLQRTLLLAAAGGMLLVAAIPTVWSFFEERRNYRRESRAQRADYQSRLAAARIELEALRNEEHTFRNDQDPSLEVLRARAIGAHSRLWERRPTDEDFLRLRIGTGTTSSLVQIAFDQRRADDTSDLAQAGAALADEFRSIGDVPILVDLKRGAVGVSGCGADLARSMVCQAAAAHSPDELLVAAFLTSDRAADWAWLKWLPHARPRRTSDPGRSLLAWDRSGHAQLANWLLGELTTRQRAADENQGGRQRLEAPWLLLVIEDPAFLVDAAVHLALARGTELRVAVLAMAERTAQLPEACRGVIEVGDDGAQASFSSTDVGAQRVLATADRATTDEAEMVARALAPLVPVRSPGQSDGDIPTRVGFFESIGVSSVDEVQLEREWRDPGISGLLRIPLGLGAGGKRVELDFKEQALGGHGPHGLVAGTTGAGKSELLMTLIAGLALRHPPDVLNFVLVDYKGGDAFRAVADLPHTIALITDLDRHLAARALAALKSELKRRERRMGELKAAGVASVAEFQHNRGDRPMPFLVIVVDEFARLKDELPEFIDGLIDVARVGRSLGVHLILATQTPSGTVDDEIQKNVNFGICLRVRDSYDSRSVIGEPDAALLPGSIPGRAYLRVGLDPIQLFQTARVGGRYAAQDETGAISITTFAPDPHDGLLTTSGFASPSTVTEGSRLEVEVLADLLKAEAQQRGLAATRWPDPLPRLVGLFDGAVEDGTPSVIGQVPTGWAATPDWLVATVGLADYPTQLEQRPLELDIARNVLVVGAAASGKSTFLRTLAISLGLTHAPEDLHIYCLDFGARNLRMLSGLPHCGEDGIFFATDGDRVRRLFRLLGRELERRRAAGITNLRQQRRQQPGERRFPFLVVLLDNFPAFREIFDDGTRAALIDNVMGDVVTLMRDGPAVGISFVVSSPQQAGITSGVLNAAESRIVLRQNDPGDYVLAGRFENPPDRVEPGRAFLGGTPPLEFQVAVTEPPDAASEGVLTIEHVLANLRERAPGFAPLSVEELPTYLSLDDPQFALTPTLSQGARETTVLLGLEDEGGGPLRLDFESDTAHLIVAAPSGSGKTTLLVTMLLSILNTQATWYLAGSPRSALLDLAQAPQCAGAATTMPQLEDLLPRLDALIDERREALQSGPGPNVGFAPVFAVFDDYDVLRQDDEYGQLGSAIAKIARRGGSVGVHVIVASTNVELRGSYDDLIRYMTQVRAGVLLQPDLEIDGDLFSVRLRRTGESAPGPGRGHLILRQTQRVFQAATVQPTSGTLKEGIRRWLAPESKPS